MQANEIDRPAAGAFAVLPDEVTLRIALECNAETLCRWGATCRRLYGALGDEHLWRILCAQAHPWLAESDPVRWGRGWRWLYATYRRDIGPASASMRVPDDRITKIAARRAVQLAPDVHYMLLCLGRKSDQDIVYVGEMDAGHNPHGYGILFRPGVFVPHAIAHTGPADQGPTDGGDNNNREDDGVSDQEVQDIRHRYCDNRRDSQGDDGNQHAPGQVPKPARTTCSDVCTRLYCDGDDVAPVVAFFERRDRVIAEHASNIRPDGTIALATLVSGMAQDGRTPRMSTHVSTGDRIEGVWHNGHFQSGTVQFYDDRRECYYKGAIRDGVYHGGGTLTRRNGEICAGQWRDGFYCAAQVGHDIENHEAGTPPLL